MPGRETGKHDDSSGYGRMDGVGGDGVERSQVKSTAAAHRRVKLLVSSDMLHSLYCSSSLYFRSDYRPSLRGGKNTWIGGWLWHRRESVVRVAGK